MGTYGSVFAVGDPATHAVVIELAKTGEGEIAVYTESHKSAEKVADILAQELTRAGAVQGVLSMEDLADTALSYVSVYPSIAERTTPREVRSATASTGTLAQPAVSLWHSSGREFVW